MRKIICFMLFAVIGITGCNLNDQPLKWCPRDENEVYTSFESISTPIIDQYGLPEKVYEYNDKDYNFYSITWYWNSNDKRIVVSFVDEQCDGWYGWRIRAIGN